ncbi:unnamed protein product [Clonostachys rosea f. rosea IK726]|uniref:Ubiquitin-like domain-containing protein n=2 Tax=Bionectria ochroleuca TaxID=29856 RepID=A0A0B7KQX4_BIOOC|nr:unnamed protein product [Clonostachys rosea f. rosea IK726]
MATQPITTESTTMTETESIILMGLGNIPVEYSDYETIGDLKHRLKTSHGYSTESQQFLFSVGFPETRPKKLETIDLSETSQGDQAHSD